MLTGFGLLVLLVAGFLIFFYLNSQSRELDQLIALEDRAETLRKRCAYHPLGKDRSVMQRNRVLIELARRRQAVAHNNHLASSDLNRLLAARRREL